MAKILDSLLPKNSTRIINLRQQYEWLKTDYDTIEERYEEIKTKKVDKFTQKLNKKLQKHAFDACDKQEFAQNNWQNDLKQYDKKDYLAQRKVKHQASKNIFEAIKEGRDWSEFLSVMKTELSTLNKKREDYIKVLDAKKQNFLAKNSKTDATKYNLELTKLQQSRQDYIDAITQKHSKLIADQKAKLDGKMQKVLTTINALKLVENAQSNKEQLSDDVILSVKGLKMYFGGLKAVDDLDFDVYKNEIFGLIGPNGAGKTTVFNCITQFYKPTAGKLLFKTKEDEVITLTDYKVHDVVLNGIARTFQNVEVVKEVSVLDNLLIAATRKYTSNLFTQALHLNKLKREERAMRNRADKILQYMDLISYRDRLCWGLPYGVLKRVEIARALMCNPQLLILDEPAAGLNESETTELAQLINKIRKDFDCTILLVEHDMSLVMNVCDHICAISFGKKLAYGTPSEVQSNKAVQEAYLGTGGE